MSNYPIYPLSSDVHRYEKARNQRSHLEERRKFIRHIKGMLATAYITVFFPNVSPLYTIPSETGIALVTLLQDKRKSRKDKSLDDNI